MKKTLLILLFVLFCGNSWATNYCTGTFTAQACWLTNAGSGSTITDSAGNSNTLTLGSVAWQSATLPARSYLTSSLNFNSNNATSGTTINLMPYNGTAYSFVAWIYTAGSGNPLRIFDKSSSTNTTGSSLFSSSPNEVGFQMSGSTSLSRISSTTMSINTWHHFAVTWDGSVTAANVHIYLDGTEVSYTTTTNGSSLTNNSSSAFVLGGRNADGTRNWDKYMAEIGIFNQVLTGAQVTDIYNNGLGAYPVNSTTIGGSKIGGATIS